MSRREKRGTQNDFADPRDEDEDAETLEPVTPPIDEDVSVSINAALPESDD